MIIHESEIDQITLELLRDEPSKRDTLTPHLMDGELEL